MMSCDYAPIRELSECETGKKGKLNLSEVFC